ncbi:hypothetical protein GTP81_13525 [Rugamonas sp. FT107W]|uniref:Uncharacterized protein n=1 Tax=Duganella vulcania TaxID=2692166 RepID=A0A845HHD7_9BURK|nr:hypothetical protein [Duganella vulcania]MYN17777.1 hypothetical protein [Duganella vulcania]
MKGIVVAACLMATPLAAWPLPEAPASAPRPAVKPAEPVAGDLSLPPPLSDELIRKAVRDTIAEDPHPVDPAKATAGVYGTTTPSVHDRMSAAFEQAKVPDCLHDDALKLQPAHIGPVAVVGPYSLPWVIAAVIRGKCR